MLHKGCVGIKNITFNEPQFQGHFPGMPIFPGVMIIEAMAQTSAILVGLSMDLVDKNAKVFFMGVDGVKFRRKVVPGDVLELHVTALRGGGRVWKFEGRAMVERRAGLRGQPSWPCSTCRRPEPDDHSPDSAQIHPSAVVEPGAVIGAGCEIGPFCVIGARGDAGRGRRR